MTPETIRLYEKILDNQKELVAAIAGVTTAEQMEALDTIAETQYIITQVLAPEIVEVGGAPDGGPVTLQ